MVVLPQNLARGAFSDYTRREAGERAMGVTALPTHEQRFPKRSGRKNRDGTGRNCGAKRGWRRVEREARELAMGILEPDRHAVSGGV